MRFTWHLRGSTGIRVLRPRKVHANDVKIGDAVFRNCSQRVANNNKWPWDGLRERVTELIV